MKLPKINYEDLPKEVRELVGEDFEFESLADGNYAVDFPVTSDRYRSERMTSAEKYVKFKKYDEMTADIMKRYESGAITKEQGDVLWAKANELLNSILKS